MQRAGARYSPLFLAMFGLFLTCLLVSNIIAGKLILVFGLVLPSAVILFPITYILGDVFTEVYGFKSTRIVIWTGFAANVLMSLVFLAALALPHPEFWKGQGAFESVLGLTPRIVFASLVAYWVGEFANSITLSALKKATKGKHLWTRTIASTVIGQGLDTALFIFLSFFGSVPPGVLVGMMLAQYLFKVAYEALLTPLTYVVVARVKAHEGIDAFDVGVAYNPFRIGGN